MRFKVYSIRDSKAEIYGNPFFQRSHGEAERAFMQLANDDKTTVNKFPDDFDLYYLGEFDDQDGKLVILETPQHVQKAAHVKQSVRPLPVDSNITAG